MGKLIKKEFKLAAFRKFAKTSGEDEADFVPAFHKFFFDDEGHADNVLEPGIFFVLGRKGAGKTLLARYVTWQASASPEAYRKNVDVQSFRNFSYHKLVPFKQESFRDKEYFTIWRWLLWVTIARQLVKDESITPTYEQANLRRLISEQFSPNLSLSDVVERTSALKLEGGLKDYLKVEKNVETKEFSRTSIDDSTTLEQLVLSSFQASSMETVVFIDDLDDGFEDTELYEQALGSLIYATDHVNRQLFRAGIRAKIVLLLRTDIFRTINTADLNKLKTDNALVLDWNVEERENSSLIRLLVHRLTVALNVNIPNNQYAEAFYELFEEKVYNRRTAVWLLDLTLARPRDLVEIVCLACQSCPSHSRFTAYALLQAQAKFSQFLYDDIRNEMKGHKPRVFIDSALSLLKGVPHKGTFSLNILRAKKPHLFSSSDGEQQVKDYLTFLYRFSAIGNLYHQPDNPSVIAYYSWAHREDQPEPDFDALFIVHSGLRHALKAGIDDEHTE